MGASDAPEKAERLYKLSYDLNIDINDNPLTRLDCEVLNPQPDLFAQDLAWMAATVAENGEDLFNRVKKMVMLTGYRSVHRNKHDGGSVADFIAFGRAIRAFARREEENQAILGAEKSKRLRAMAQLGAVPALLALGLLGDAAAQSHAKAEFLKAVHTYDPGSQGDLLDRSQEIALRALATLAARHSLAPETVCGVFRFIAEDKRGLGGLPDLVEWLATIAARQRLPEKVVNYLLSQLEHPSEPEGFEPLQAFRILARSSQFLKPDLRARLSKWVDTHGDPNRRQDAWAEGLGYLAAAMTLPEKEVRGLADRIEPDVYFSSAAATARGTTIIRSTDEPAGVALGRVAQHQPLDKDLVDLLGALPSRAGHQGPSRSAQGPCGPRPLQPGPAPHEGVDPVSTCNRKFSSQPQLRRFIAMLSRPGCCFRSERVRRFSQAKFSRKFFSRIRDSSSR